MQTEHKEEHNFLVELRASTIKIMLMDPHATSKNNSISFLGHIAHRYSCKEHWLATFTSRTNREWGGGV